LLIDDAWFPALNKLAAENADSGIGTREFQRFSDMPFMSGMQGVVFSYNAQNRHGFLLTFQAISARSMPYFTTAGPGDTTYLYPARSTSFRHNEMPGSSGETVWYPFAKKVLPR
jgi:hypothetical protein